MGLRINGYEYSFASVKLDANGQKVTGLKGVDYANSVERGQVRGVGIQVLAHTRGQASAEATLTFSTLSAYEAFKQSLGDGYMETVFDIVVSYAEEGQPLITDKIVGCRLKKPSRSAQQGTEALEVSCELDINYVNENGQLPFKNMRL